MTLMTRKQLGIVSKYLDSDENVIFRIASGFLSHSGYFFGGL
jgi:hypothetical protein